MENVAVVDLLDRIIGKTTKKHAHEKGLLHRTVIAEVVTSKGLILLVKQASHKQDAGQFVLPVGGHVTAGETPLEGLKREAKEELGITSFKEKFIGKAIFDRAVNKQRENHYFYVYEIDTDLIPVLNEESIAYTYLTVAELKKQLQNNPEFFGDAFWFVVRTFYKQWVKDE